MRFVAPLIALASIALLAGCSSAGPVKGTAEPAAHTATATPSSTPTPTPSKTADALGTRANPFPIGTPGKYDQKSMWTFTFLSVDGDATKTVIADEPDLNSAPDAGKTYVLATVKIDAGTTETAENPYNDVEFNYVGSDGNTYPANPDQCGDLGDTDFAQATEMYSGATRTFTMCAQVPQGASAGGTWAIDYFDGTSPTAFFKGA